MATDMGFGGVASRKLLCTSSHAPPPSRLPYRVHATRTRRPRHAPHHIRTTPTSAPCPPASPSSSRWSRPCTWNSARRARRAGRWRCATHTSSRMCHSNSNSHDTRDNHTATPVATCQARRCKPRYPRRWRPGCMHVGQALAVAVAVAVVVVGRPHQVHTPRLAAQVRARSTDEGTPGGASGYNSGRACVSRRSCPFAGLDGGTPASYRPPPHPSTPPTRMVVVATAVAEMGVDRGPGARTHWVATPGVVGPVLGLGQDRHRRHRRHHRHHRHQAH